MDDRPVILRGGKDVPVAVPGDVPVMEKEVLLS